MKLGVGEEREVEKIPAQLRRFLGEGRLVVVQMRRCGFHAFKGTCLSDPTQVGMRSSPCSADRPAFEQCLFGQSESCSD